MALIFVNIIVAQIWLIATIFGLLMIGGGSGGGSSSGIGSGISGDVGSGGSGGSDIGGR